MTIVSAWVAHGIGTLRVDSAMRSSAHLPGLYGIASIIFFLIGFTAIGWNYLVQVNYSPIEFVASSLASVDPPPPAYVSPYRP